MNNVKTKSNENVFKVEHCGSSLLTSNRKMNLEKTKLQAKSAFKVVANGVYTAKLETKNHSRRQEREQLALMTADV